MKKLETKLENLIALVNKSKNIILYFICTWSLIDCVKTGDGMFDIYSSRKR